MKRGMGKPFAKGRSGNPGGRPRLPVELRARAQAVTGDMLDTLVALARDPGQPGNVRVSAANSVLDRGHGRPVATVSVGAKHSLADYSTAELFALAAAFVDERGPAPAGDASSLPN